MKVLSFSDLNQPEKRAGFIQDLGDSLKNTGFVALKDHGLDQLFLEKCYKTSEEFFLLDSQTKKQYEKEELNGQRGFVSFGKETAKGASISDIKEFWHVAREGTGEANIWPTEVTDFKETFTSMYDQLDKMSAQLLDAISINLELPEKTFSSITRGGESILRLLHYPPLKNNYQAGAVRAAAHTDINFITLLVSSSADGLQVQDREGNWVDAPKDENLIICDCGDMIENMTNGVLPATPHRVVNPDKDDERRLSMPFFVHARLDEEINPLQQMIDIVGEKKYRDMTAGDYLNERLIELGLK